MTFRQGPCTSYLGRLPVLSVQGFAESLGYFVPANTAAHLTSFSSGAPSNFPVHSGASVLPFC